MLWILVTLPVVIGLYILLDRQRRAQAASFTSLQPAMNSGPGWRSQFPPALFLLSLATILVALARPQAEIELPRVEGTVILVFDVSASMSAEDVEPTRMEAAKTVASEFILSQPETVKIGIVTFSGSGFTVQTPTNDAETLLAAINRLKPTRGTSLGQGIYTALHTIAVDAGLAKLEQISPEVASATQSPAQGAPEQGPLEDDLLSKLPEGAYPSAVIVLLTDGEHNQSIDPLEAALAAAEHDVRIDALGFGTPAGAILELDGYSVHTALDEAVLQLITQAADGTYYAAQSEQDPQAVYAKLTPELVVKAETIELTALFAGAGILFLLAGSLFSMLWFNRLV